MSFVLSLMCPDRPGLIHDVTAALLESGSNITENAQFADAESGTFCMRTVLSSEATNADEIADAVVRHLGEPPTHLRVRPLDVRPRVLLMVSKLDHCLVDVLYRYENGTLPIDVALIVSNHPDCEPIAERHGIPFVHIAVTRASKAAAEAQLRQLIDSHCIDLVVLARYMQILSDGLCEDLRGRVINIHHSFLPGFKGAKPYHQAHARGVKLIGATAHFVTGELDEGPIIEQDVARVTHAHSPASLVELGKDTERLVLARAVRLVAEERVLLLGDKTVVFS